METVYDPPESVLLAHRYLKRCAHRIGPYHVDVEFTVNVVMVGLIRGAMGRPLVIDEIAQMELLSDAFRREIIKVFDSDAPVIATIHAREDPFTDALKARADVRLFTVTRDNRDALRPELTAALADLLA